LSIDDFLQYGLDCQLLRSKIKADSHPNLQKREKEIFFPVLI